MPTSCVNFLPEIFITWIDLGFSVPKSSMHRVWSLKYFSLNLLSLTSAPTLLSGLSLNEKNSLFDPEKGLKPHKKKIKSGKKKQLNRHNKSHVKGGLNNCCGFINFLVVLCQGFILVPVISWMSSVNFLWPYTYITATSSAKAMKVRPVAPKL